VLILRNDPQLKLFNGDVGLLWPDAEAGGEVRAFFLDAAGALRRLLPARLPAHETAYAMTVHKCQGSEFDRVLLMLPDRDTPVATRELVYTGLTRARRFVELWAGEAILRAAIARRTQRASGLREALWGAA
jgi:exodeoxyribonuclease V alpha subunit